MVAEMVRYTDNGMGLDEANAAYLAACEVEGKSRRTVDAYAETLAMFRDICLRERLPDRVDGAVLHRLARVRASPNQPHAVSRRQVGPPGCEDGKCTEQW